MADAGKNLDAAPLDGSERYGTNRPLTCAGDVDQELSWTREEFKKIGARDSPFDL